MRLSSRRQRANQIGPLPRIPLRELMDEGPAGVLQELQALTLLRSHRVSQLLARIWWEVDAHTRKDLVRQHIQELCR